MVRGHGRPGMVVISVSLSGDELERFDKLVEHFGYDSRSSAIRDALYHFVARHRMDFEGHVDLVLTLVYAADGGQDAVHQVTHAHEDLIRTSLHNHIDERCVDTLIVHGDGQEVHALLDELTQIDDVRVNVTSF